MTESPTFFRGGRRFHRLADAAKDAPPAFDASALAARVLLLSPLDPRQTIYEGVELEHPGVFSPERLRHLERRTWPAVSARNAGSELQRSLRSAVDRSLEGRRCVAVLTGGGLDSSVLLALACDWAKRTGHRAFGVALDFAGEGDDRPFLAELEAHLGCEVLRCRPEDGAKHFDLFLRGVDASPFTWCGGPMEVEMLARARSEGAEVVLSGSGGDELFDGHPRSLAERVRRQGWFASMRDAAELEGFSKSRLPAVDWIVRPYLSRITPTALRRLRAARHRRPPTWAGPVSRAFHRAWFAARIEDDLADKTNAHERRRVFLGSPHREHLLWLRHQEEVEAQAVAWDPYLDPVLIEDVLRFPPDWLLRGNVRRGLFREATKGLIPENLRRRSSKAAFEPAFLRLFRASDGYRKFRDYADVRELSSLGIVRREEFRAHVEAFLSNPEIGDGWTTVLPVLATEAFLRASEARSS